MEMKSVIADEVMDASILFLFPAISLSQAICDLS